MIQTDTKARLEDLTSRAIAGEVLPAEDIYWLLEVPSADLREAAARVTATLPTHDFDSCSIINARSGACPEDCKWCAQSARYHTGCEVYPLVSEEECMTMARHHSKAGIKRFSMVASGRVVKGQALERIATMLEKVKNETGLSTCASLGLLNREQLQRLWDAGARRYHCNLETAPSFFPSLCTTHSWDDKLATINAAREVGFEVCSGGIIGMGESRRQRAEFAIELRRAHPVSIPINILSPIPGTPLEHQAAISDDDILDTVAIFRMAHPKMQLRFAGGRARLTPEVQVELMRIGINGGIVGDMLTTTGSTLEKDKQMIAEAGYKF